MSCTKVVQDVRKAVRVAAYNEPESKDWIGWAEVRREDGTRTLISTLERHLPRNGGKARLVACPNCNKPRQAFYGWKPGGPFTNSARHSRWQCRECARLRYASEGGALLYRPCTEFGRIAAELDGFSTFPRPEPWHPYVFSSPAAAAAAGSAKCDGRLTYEDYR